MSAPLDVVWTVLLCCLTFIFEQNLWFVLRSILFATIALTNKIKSFKLSILHAQLQLTYLMYAYVFGCGLECLFWGICIVFWGAQLRLINARLST